MEIITISEFEKIIQRKLKTNQLLLALSVVMGMSVFFIKNNNAYWAIAFIMIGSLCLPNINRCKEDLKNYKHGILGTTEGKILDSFPENENKQDGQWIIFLEIEGEKEFKEFIFPQNPNVEINSFVKIYHTKIMGIPVRIEPLDVNK